MSKEKKEKKLKKSIFAEFSLLSAGSLILILGFIAACVVFYVYMATPPAKKVKLNDYARVLSDEEEAALLEKAKHRPYRDYQSQGTRLH